MQLELDSNEKLMVEIDEIWNQDQFRLFVPVMVYNMCNFTVDCLLLSSLAITNVHGNESRTICGGGSCFAYQI